MLRPASHENQSRVQCAAQMSPQPSQLPVYAIVHHMFTLQPTSGPHQGIQHIHALLHTSTLSNTHQHHYRSSPYTALYWSGLGRQPCSDSNVCNHVMDADYARHPCGHAGGAGPAGGCTHVRQA